MTENSDFDRPARRPDDQPPAASDPYAPGSPDAPPSDPARYGSAPSAPSFGEEPTTRFDPSAAPPPASYGGPSAPSYDAPSYGAPSSGPPASSYEPPAYGTPTSGAGAPPPSSGPPSYGTPSAPPGYGAPADPASGPPGAYPAGAYQPGPGYPPAGGPPQGGYPTGAPYPAGSAANDEKTWNLVSHFGGALGVFVGGGVLGWVAPLVSLMAKGQQFPNVRAHAVEALNFQITWAVISVVGYILGICGSFVIVGAIFFLVPLAAFVIAIVFSIIAGTKANNGEFYKYPMSLRLVK